VCPHTGPDTRRYTNRKIGFAPIEHAIHPHEEVRRRTDRQHDFQPLLAGRRVLSNAMRSLWFALLFLAGGLSHELRKPVNCECVVARQAGTAKRRQSFL
jgi:hypothetical protein